MYIGVYLEGKCTRGSYRCNCLLKEDVCQAAFKVLQVGYDQKGVVALYSVG